MHPVVKVVIAAIVMFLFGLGILAGYWYETYKDDEEVGVKGGQE